MNDPIITFIDVLVEGVQETQYLAMEGQRCVGRVGVKFAGLSVAQVRQLFVEPEFRHKGVGGNLMAECEVIAKQAGCEAIALTVARCNASVTPFYTKREYFTVVEYADGEIVMAKRLGRKDQA